VSPVWLSQPEKPLTTEYFAGSLQRRLNRAEQNGLIDDVVPPCATSRQIATQSSPTHRLWAISGRAKMVLPKLGKTDRPALENKLRNKGHFGSRRPVARVVLANSGDISTDVQLLTR